MKQQLLKTLKDLSNQTEKEYHDFMATDLDQYDLDDRSHIESLHSRSNTIIEIIKLVEESGSCNEPLHNHHDGCPSCDMDKPRDRGYVISPWVHLDNCIHELEKQVARIKRTVKAQEL